MSTPDGRRKDGGHDPDVGLADDADGPGQNTIMTEKSGVNETGNVQENHLNSRPLPPQVSDYKYPYSGDNQ